jgi:hypothetical protein
LPGRGPDTRGLSLARVIGGEQEKQFRLQRVGILELVDEEATESPLKVRADLLAVAHEVPRSQEQIQEIERAVRGLQRFVAVKAPLQLVTKQRGEIGIGVRLELVEVGKQRLMGRLHVRPRDAFGERGPHSLPGPAEIPVPAQIDQHRLRRVVITSCRNQAELVADAPCGSGIDKQGSRALAAWEVVAANAWTRPVREGDLALPHEVRPRPSSTEVAPLDKIPSSRPQPLHRTVVARVTARD